MVSDKLLKNGKIGSRFDILDKMLWITIIAIGLIFGWTGIFILIAISIINAILLYWKEMDTEDRKIFKSEIKSEQLWEYYVLFFWGWLYYPLKWTGG